MKDIEMGEPPRGIKTTSGLHILQESTSDRQTLFDNICFLALYPSESDMDKTEYDPDGTFQLGRRISGLVWDALNTWESTNDH
ncbi:MAG: hypothetical protein GY906_24485 [bacterium]|nr:hypothetical protein [bacterium]